MVKNKKGLNFTFTGFIIALILIAMFAGAFGSMISNMNTEYSKSGNNTFTKYEGYTDKIEKHTKEIKNSTSIKQDTGFVDIIGGFFASGYSALKVSATSFNIFNNMTNDMTEDVPEFAYFKTYLTMIIIVGLFVGVVIAALLKWRV